MDQVNIKTNVLPLRIHEAERFEIIFDTGNDLAALHDFVNSGNLYRRKFGADLGHTRILTRPNIQVPWFHLGTKPFVIQFVVRAIRFDILQREVHQIAEVGIAFRNAHTIRFAGEEPANDF